MSKRTEQNKIAALQLICEAFPRALSIYSARRKPLRAGIHRQIYAALGGALTESEISAAMSFYTSSESYLEKMVEGAWRVGLTGQQEGVVTLDEAKYAAERRALLYARKVCRA